MRPFKIAQLLMLFAPLIVAMMSTGCTQHLYRQSAFGAEKPVYESAEQVAIATTLVRDDYAKHTSIKGPYIYPSFASKKDFFLSSIDNKVRYHGYGTSYYLRTTIWDSGRRMDVVYLNREWPASGNLGWTFLDDAYDHSGRQLRVHDLGHHVTTSVTTFVHLPPTLHVWTSIQLDDAYLRKAAAEGIDIKATGSGGQTIVQLPPHYVQGFLTTLDAFLANQ